MEITNKTGISPTQLGRERKRYEEMLQLDGVTKKQVDSQMLLDAKRYAAKLNKVVTIEDYKADIEALAKPANSGKREADKIERDNLIMETQDMLGAINLAIQSKRDKVKLTTEQKVSAFDALGARAIILAEHMESAFDKFGALTMIHAPTGLMSVHISGWEDGSKTNRYQYAPRKVPVSKRSGYRDDSFDAPILKLDSMKPTKSKAPKRKDKVKGSVKTKPEPTILEETIEPEPTELIAELLVTTEELDQLVETLNT